MKFTKIKRSKGLVVLEWLTEEGKGGLDTHEHRLSSTEDPHPTFVAALRAFIGPVLKLCELPHTWGGEALAVTGLSITHEEERGRGLVVTCQRSLADAPAPLVFNTPYLPEDAGEHGQSLPDELVEALDAVEDAARRFLNGERAQGDLFAGEGRVSPTVARAARAIEKLRPKKGSGIESVEITANGRGVRLTAHSTEAL